MTGTPLLDVQHLSVRYRRRRRDPWVQAVDDVTFAVQSGETVGLVGESGSGKTSLGRAILGLTPVHSGTIAFDGTEITALTPRQRRLRNLGLQAVFQDPVSSLNPSFRVGWSVREPLTGADRATSAAPGDLVAPILAQVGLPGDAQSRFPAQFSGGQLQRISMARALITHPRLVICDEPVSALDLSTQAQILNLLARLQRSHGLAYLFISHDLAVVRHFCSRIVVLYRGRVMEQGPAQLITANPGHPYTMQLVSASPSPNPDVPRECRLDSARRAIAPAAAATGHGCIFAGRCPVVMDECWTERPEMTDAGGGRTVACHRQGARAAPRDGRGTAADRSELTPKETIIEITNSPRGTG